MKGMTTVWHDMGFFAWEPKTETERFEADWALLFVLGVVTGDDGDGSRDHVGERVC